MYTHRDRHVAVQQRMTHRFSYMASSAVSRGDSSGSEESAARPQSPRLTVPVAPDVADMLSSSQMPGSLSAARRSAFSAD
mgnify:CR=1 FL=1